MIKLKYWVFGSAILLGGIVLAGCGTSGHPIASAPRHHSQAVSSTTSASPSTSSTTPSSGPVSSSTPGGLSSSAPASSTFQTERVTIQPSPSKITVQLEVPSGWKKQSWNAGDSAGFVWVNPLNSTEWVRLIFSGNVGGLQNNKGHYDVTSYVNNPGVQWRFVPSNKLSGQFTIPIGGIANPISSYTNLNKYVAYGYAEVITRPNPLGVEIDAVAPKNVAKVISTSVIIH